MPPAAAVWRAIRRAMPVMLALPALALAQTADKPVHGLVRVRLTTSAGPIVLALDAQRAPKTTANFLAYVDDGRLDGTTFFRAARRADAPRLGLIEGGIGNDRRRMLDPIVLEPTSKTGIHHGDGTISMARTTPDSATGNFSLLIGPSPSMDARPGDPGYAAFGRVIAGMETVKAILALPSGGGSGVMKGQMLLKPVKIIRAQRLDGTPHPTGKPQPWLFMPAS
jgi:peptidyl-prolyl cis-trans isomerase A (cyclophilin A)